MITDSDRHKAVTKALEYAQTMSANKASDKAAKPLGVTGRTVRTWATKAGTPIASASQEAAKKAREAARIQYQAQREQLKVRMSQLAHDLLDACYSPHEEYMTSKDGPARVLYERPRSGDIKNYATSIGILVDKCRLEEGKATERHETMSMGAVEAWLSEQEQLLGLND